MDANYAFSCLYNSWSLRSLLWISCQASSQEGALKVFELLQGKTFRSVGWSTLFDCLSIYEEKFKQALQSPGAILPEFQEGDAKALVAYLNVLQKVFTCFTPKCHLHFQTFCWLLAFGSARYNTNLELYASGAFYSSFISIVGVLSWYQGSNADLNVLVTSWSATLLWTTFLNDINISCSHLC